jgi:hypothetical protein
VDEPGTTVAEVEEPEGGANEKSWPAPLSATVCGLPEALSEMVSVPVLDPPIVGVKVTEMTQFEPALRVVPQVLVWEKSPPAVMLVIVSGELPMLISVTVWTVLVPSRCAGKVREEADKLTAVPTLI